MMNTKMLTLGLCLICSNSYAAQTEAIAQAAINNGYARLKNEIKPIIEQNRNMDTDSLWTKVSDITWKIQEQVSQGVRPKDQGNSNNPLWIYDNYARIEKNNVYVIETWKRDELDRKYLAYVEKVTVKPNQMPMIQAKKQEIAVLCNQPQMGSEFLEGRQVKVYNYTISDAFTNEFLIWRKVLPQVMQQDSLLRGISGKHYENYNDGYIDKLNAITKYLGIAPLSRISNKKTTRPKTEAEINEENIRYLEEQQRKQDEANRQRDQDDNLKNAAGNLLNSLF